MSWLRDIADQVARSGPLVRVTVIAAEGSTPREVGAAMLVLADRIDGTIGGGALEHDAILVARGLLEADDGGRWRREQRSYPLGPSLGQCCGGHVRLVLERFGAGEIGELGDLTLCTEGALVVRPLASGVAPTIMTNRKQALPPRRVAIVRSGIAMPSQEEAQDLPPSLLRIARQMLSGERPRAVALVPGRKGHGDWLIEPAKPPLLPLYLYGAGHVGMAVVRALEGLPFAVTWVDVAADRFPSEMPANAIPVVMSDPSLAAALAPPDALHLVMTYSHALDLAICHAILSRDQYRWLGLIGSATKRARFAKRLAGAGIREAELQRMVCPIGLPGLGGKEPAAIAISVAAQLIGIAEARAEVIDGGAIVRGQAG